MSEVRLWSVEVAAQDTGSTCRILGVRGTIPP